MMHQALGGAGGTAGLWGGGGPVQEIRDADKKLCTGCRTGDINLVRQALDDGGNASVQFRLALGEITPIFLCASKGYKEIAELLIEKQREIIHDRMGFDGTTCLHHAASNNQAEMCELLISNGCDVNLKDKLGIIIIYHISYIDHHQYIHHKRINFGSSPTNQSIST